MDELNSENNRENVKPDENLENENELTETAINHQTETAAVAEDEVKTEEYSGQTGETAEEQPQLVLEPKKEKTVYSSIPEEPVRHQTGVSKKTLIAVVVAALLLSIGSSALTAWLVSKNSNTVVAYQAVEKETTTVVTTTDYTELVEMVADTVVEVYTEQVSYHSYWGNYVTEGAGSGVIYSSDGYIITNNHVIEGASTIKVTLTNGTTYDAKLIAADAKTDLAVIKIEATGLPTAVLGNSDSIKVGQNIVAIGNPLGSLGGTVTAGIVSALSREITVENIPMTLMQIGVSISPGNSGGGLFNTNGELIGIVNAKSTSDYAEGIGFAIPINTVKEVVTELITNGYVTGRAQLGIKCKSVDSMQAAWSLGVNTYGVYVSELVSDEAKASDLQAGDMIVAIDGTEITSLSQLQIALYAYSAGDEVQLTVVRGHEKFTIPFTLAQKS